MDFLGTFSNLMSRASSDSPVDIRSSSDINTVLLELEKHVKAGGRNFEPIDQQIEAVKRFLQTGHIDTLRDARRVAFGLVVAAAPNRACLLEEKELFGEALHEFDRWKNQSSPRQYSKCYQGLVRSYFDYDGKGRETPEVGKVNWRKLRDYLNDNADKIRSEGINPDWVTCAANNVTLFTGEPCAAYGKDLLAGNESVVNEIRRLLGISDTSWFTEELILARLREATHLDHSAFQATLSSLLRLLGRNKILQSSGLKILLNRHVKIPLKPQHPELKDFSVACWGNPWLPSNSDSWGGISDEARQMVTEWLSHEYIELFFTKLTQDGLSDTRRVKFWSKYVKSIDRMYFALGGRARDPDERDFVELRQKLQGLTVALQDPNINNNAFIMQMGNLLAVEFSGRSNSFYGYDITDGMPFDLSRTVRTPVDGVNSLKQSSNVLKLSHTDNVRGYVDWEDRLEEELRRKFGIRPGVASLAKTPTESLVIAQSATERLNDTVGRWFEVRQSEEIIENQPQIHSMQSELLLKNSVPQEATAIPPSIFASKEDYQPFPYPKDRPFSMNNLFEFSLQTGYQVQDRSGKGGALWVWAPYHIDHVRDILSAWEFKFTAGKGWWKQV